MSTDALNLERGTLKVSFLNLYYMGFVAGITGGKHSRN